MITHRMIMRIDVMLENYKNAQAEENIRLASVIRTEYRGYITGLHDAGILTNEEYKDLYDRVEDLWFKIAIPLNIEYYI